MLFVKGQANVPEKTTSLTVACWPSSRTIATGEEKRSPARALGITILALGERQVAQLIRPAAGLSVSARVLIPGKTGFRLPSVLVYQIRNKASASRTEDEVHFLAGVAVMVYR